MKIKDCPEQENHRKFLEKKLIVATHNLGKFKEIQKLFNRINVELLSSIDMGLPVPNEIGSSFEENAYIKSSETTMLSGLASISDDSGLLVNSLQGSPGIYSADWAGPDRDFKKAINKIEYLMRKTEDFSASMICVLCLSWGNGDYKIFKGEMHGKITFPPVGVKGFGYDSIFIPNVQPFKSKSLTYAQIEPDFKNLNSHRNIAFNKLFKSCF